MDITPHHDDAAVLSLRERVEAVLGAFLLDDSASPDSAVWDEVDFRRRILGVCGFDDRDGLELAIRVEIGLKEPLALVEAGCTPHLAARIVL